MTDTDLPELVRRLRDRDSSAVAELVRRYEPDIRRIARVRLNRFGLRHLLDSDDIAQSVFGRFFARLDAGGWELESPEKLLHLLAVIAANKVTSHARRERKQVRPTGGASEADGFEAQADSAPGPDRVAAARDQLDWVLRALTPADRVLFLGRASGRGWAELAQEHGVEPDALRKRFTRALDDTGLQLGLGDAPAG